MDSQIEHEQEKARPLKTNGFYCPLHPMQIASWIVTLSVNASFYTLVSPGFNKDEEIVINIIITLSFVILFILAMIGKLYQIRLS